MCQRTWSSTILIHTRTTNDCTDGIVVPYCVVKSFQNDHANALATTISLSLVGEGEALSIFSEEVERCHGHHGSRGKDHPNTSSNGQIGAASSQVLAAVMHTDKARAASCVHRLAGAPKVKLIGNTIRENGGTRSSSSVLRSPVCIPEDDLLIVYRGNWSGHDTEFEAMWWDRWSLTHLSQKFPH